MINDVKIISLSMVTLKFPHCTYYLGSYIYLGSATGMGLTNDLVYHIFDRHKDKESVTILPFLTRQIMSFTSILYPPIVPHKFLVNPF
jgi:hypothetical protein